MRRFFILCLAIAAGAAAARMFDGVSGTALAGGDKGGGGEEPCAAVNGDVNADGSVDISDAVTILSNLFLGDPAQLVPLCKAQGPSGLPDTGQSVCSGFFEGQGWVTIPCAEATCPGQDGAYATGCPPEGRFIDNGDGTVTDTCTGLMWQQDTADVNGDGQSTDQDFVRWCAALAYCENLSFAGHDDWRLPNVRELQSIVDYGRFGPSIDPVFGALSLGYWSSTSLADSPASGWYVNFLAGHIYDDDGNFDDNNVRAVRRGT